MDDPTEDEITAVLEKLREDRWQDFSERETAVAKWIVDWDDMDTMEGDL